ncbi:hypothetical protein HPP92_028250, partial [Vanilla planifolia]
LNIFAKRKGTRQIPLQWQPLLNILNFQIGSPEPVDCDFECVGNDFPKNSICSSLKIDEAQLKALAGGIIGLANLQVDLNMSHYRVCMSSLLSHKHELESLIFIKALSDLRTLFANLSQSRKVVEIIHSQFNLLVESRTDRIVFKLFGKTPNDFPHVLRAQVYLHGMRWILRFAIDRDWTAIVKKLLDILFEENIDSGMLCPTEIALSEDLLHYAVRSNSKSIFGLKAWRNAKDSTCLTPEDYAIAGGHESYILLMLKKINKSTEKKDVVVVNIPAKLPLMSDATYEFCKLCEQHLECRSSLGRSILYRPMLPSMVGIAAVCVCVGLLLKGPPEVGFMRHPFSFFLEEIFPSKKTCTESSCCFFCLLDDLTTTLVQQCRECQYTIQRIIETAAEDEAVLFEALNVNDELQKTLSKYEGMKKPRAMHSEPQPALIPVAVEPEDSPRRDFEPQWLSLTFSKAIFLSNETSC